MVEGGMKCIKILLFAFNLLFVLAGILLIAVGAYVKIKLNEYSDVAGSEYLAPGIMLIVVGVIIFLLAFFGCCGAIKENYCLTMTYAVCLGVIFVLEIAGGIAGFVKRDEIESELNTVLNDSLNRYNSSAGVRDTWAKIQEEFKCCGVQNYTDWTKKTSETKPPESCCKKVNCDTKVPANIWDEGCSHAFEQWMKDKVAIIGGVGIGFAFIQVVGILFACCLARAIRKEYEVV